MKQHPSIFRTPHFLPQEEKLAVKTSRSQLIIGVPREHSFQENRVALCPESIQFIVENGHRVLVEQKAGLLAGFPDNEYAEAGAEIVPDSKHIFSTATIIIKVAPPTIEELKMTEQGKTIISALHPTAQTIEYYKTMMSKKLTAFAYEMIQDNTGRLPVLQSMSEIAGYTAIQIASEYLSRTDVGRGVILGSITGINPPEVVIIGAGTVGEFAARAALALGAVVKVFDNKLYKLKSILEKLNYRVYTSIIHPNVLGKALKTADVLITALHTHSGKAPIVVTEEMVATMKKGSIIIDVSIDQGGCVETSMPTTHTNPVYQFHGVTHYCVPNMPSRVPRTASFALSNFFSPVIVEIGEHSSIEQYLSYNEGMRKGVYMLNGTLTNKVIGEYHNLPYQDIELLIAAFLR